MSPRFPTARRFAAALALTLAAPLMIGGTGLGTNLDARLLAAHNRERAALGIAPLRWDPALVASAERWGGELAALGDIEHEVDSPDDPDPEGENLWMGTRAAWAPEEMVGMWIDEKAHFVPGRFPDVSRTGSYEDVGHYTQLMWRDTGRVGCAIVANADDDILVCRYAQAGNVYGERPF